MSNLFGSIFSPNPGGGWPTPGGAFANDPSQLIDPFAGMRQAQEATPFSDVAQTATQDQWAAPQVSPTVPRGGGTSTIGSGGTTWDTLAPQAMYGLENDLGVSRKVSAAVVGNLGHESAGFAKLIGDNGASNGWAHWNVAGGRKQGLHDTAASMGRDWRDPSVNYAYLLHELKQPRYQGMLQRMEAAPTAHDAAKIFSDEFERPGVPAYGSRFKWTDRALALAEQGGPQTPMEAFDGGQAGQEAPQPPAATVAAAESDPAPIPDLPELSLSNVSMPDDFNETVDMISQLTPQLERNQTQGVTPQIQEQAINDIASMLGF